MRVWTSGVTPLLLVAAVLCLAGCGTHPIRHDVTPLAQSAQGRSAHWFPPLLVGRDGAQYPGARLQALPAQAPLLTTQEQKRENSEATWRGLTALSQAQADALPPVMQTSALHGWLALRRIGLDSRESAGGMAPYFLAWQAHRPRLPGALTQALPLVGSTLSRPATVNKIAVLLPLSGQAAKFGQAIRLGLAAQKRAGGWLSGPLPTLRFYDTSAAPVETLLAQAEKDGATLVVGPLLKPDVRALLSIHTPLDVLALNLPENPVYRDNLCYFALSPEDEARGAARHILTQGKHRPLLLLPRGEIGDRIAGAFRNEWERQGGGPVLLQRFGSLSTLKAAVNSGKGVSLTGVRVGGTDAQSAPADPASDTRARGGGADAVYMIATPAEALYLRAMIVMRNGSRSGDMLYASSRSIRGQGGPDAYLEMEGLQFSDLPMLSGASPRMKQQALSATRGDDVLARLYAMGADAWLLAAQFSHLHQTPGAVLSGHTGKLSVTPECVITRTLPWFRYRQGRVIPSGISDG